MDVYCYVTLTTDAEPRDVPALVATFVDRLQEVHENLPLRTVPLQVAVYGPVQPRIQQRHSRSLARQEFAVQAWNDEIAERFRASDRAVPIADVPLAAR